MTTKDENGKRKVLALDLESLEYREKQKAKFPEVDKIKKLPWRERLHAALRLEGRAGDFLRKVYLPLFNYSANRLGEISDGPKEIDDAMKWGYGWDQGPFAMWDAVGVKWAVEQIEAMGHAVAPAAKALLAASRGVTSQG